MSDGQQTLDDRRSDRCAPGNPRGLVPALAAFVTVYLAACIGALFYLG